MVHTNVEQDLIEICSARQALYENMIKARALGDDAAVAILIEKVLSLPEKGLMVERELMALGFHISTYLG